jgi:hypothetical protein
MANFKFLSLLQNISISIFFEWNDNVSYFRIQKSSTVQLSVIYQDLISWNQAKIKSCVNTFSPPKGELFSKYAFVDN